MDYTRAKNKQDEIAQAIMFLSGVINKTNVKVNVGTFVSEQTIFDLEEVNAIKGNILTLVADYVEVTDKLIDSLTENEQEN